MRIKKWLCGVLSCAMLLGVSNIAYAKEVSTTRAVPELTMELKASGEEIVPIMPLASGNVSAGYVTGYLTESGDSDLYTITIPSSYMLQVQLEQPSSSAIDYDLYLFDMDENIVDSSENVTYISNGNTLDECVAYINKSGAEVELYILVNSYMGGSATDAYTLTYALTNVYDSYEPDEQPGMAGEFVFSGSSDSISSRNISSPIDRDWYKVTVPSGYDQMQLSISTSSTNTHALQVYRNIASGGMFQMVPVSLSNGKLEVSAGEVYYIKVYYGGTLNSFNQNSILNYTLSVSFSVKQLLPGSITITGYSGGTYVTYAAGRYYRVTGSTFTVTGVVRDTEGHVMANEPVMAAFMNPAWEGDSRYGMMISEGVTDSSGRYTLTITMPHSAGLEKYYVDPSTHYYDTCILMVVANNDVMAYDFIYQYAYSAYGDNT